MNAAENQSFISPDSNRNNQNFKLDIQLTGVQYFSESAEDSKSQQQSQIESQYEKPGPIRIKAHGLAGTFSLPKSSYFAIPELYLGFSSSDNKQSISFGRKINKFSFLDKDQNLALFNSQFTNDKIKYQELGLVGLHAEGQVEQIGFYAGYYPLYFPNQGPQVYEQNGEIRSSNRWAQKPPSQFRFGNLNREIVYAIREYDINEIIKNSGEAFSVFFGTSKNRPWIQASYARKPVNEIPLTRDTYGTASNFVGQVKLSPMVTYSQVQAVDINLDKSRFQTTLSYLEDRVFNKPAPENETLQFLKPLKMYGIWTATDLTDFFKRNVIAEVSYAELYDGDIQDYMADGRTSIFTFTGQRSLFKKPFSIKINTELFFIQTLPVKTSMKWTYDQAYKGTLFSGAASYQTWSKVGFNIGFDLLGVEEISSVNHFLQDKQANDRVYGGLEYVF